MKKLSYKITGVVAAIAAATALSAAAQDTQATMPQDATPPAATPQTAPATPDAAPQATAPTAAAPVASTAADGNAAKDFMKEAFMANEFTIAASQLAASQGGSAEVKAAAKTVLDNGMKTRESMIAAIQGSTSDMHFDQAYTPEYTQKLGELKAAKGPDFDSKYVAAQGEVNDKAETVFKAYAASGTDESVKTFAANTLPTLDASGNALDQVAQGGQ
ncbi:DUF4142 domain-containing protein [Asticcacaulis sp. 201]|uniref:DUF4142 domain-containing protein n=1 Tax=Asticcacaulis sp. 201 TaxID=3028787 RepID=UPI0029163244|nr:DUF4142 domain-containing protein [Asticcacaulis sp. 201]MDV6331863.1 DUF4142 domain-containing protein [Asticcacaulis sp. 201]